MKLRHWMTWPVCVLVGAFIISSAQADTLTNVFSATMTLNGYIDSFFDGSGNPLPGVVVKVDPMPLNSEAPLSASSTKAPQAYHPSAFNQRGIMSAYNPFVNGGTIYIGVDLPGGDGSPANPNYTDAKGPTRGTAGPGGMPAIVPFDADGDGLAQSIGTNTISGTDMKRCSDMGTTDIIDCGLQINAGFTDAATDAGVIENYSANVTFGDGTFVTVNLFESQSTGVGLARLQQCGGCPPAIADETAGKTFGAAASTASGGTLNGAPLGLDVEFAITNVNANVDACNRLIQTVSVNSGSNSDGNDNGEDFNTLSVNYVLPATLSCDVLFFTNQTTRITTNGCGTAAPVGVKLGDQVTISVVVSAASTNAQNISSYTVNISGVGSITVNSPLAPGQSATNVVGTFTCNAPGVNTFQATVNGVGAITASCFPINTDCSATLQCCGNTCVSIFKSIACFPAGGGDCSSIAPSSYSKSATGYKTDAGDPAFCYRVTVTNCGNVALQNVVVVDDHQGTLTFSTSLPVNGTETHYFFASHDTNTMNTVQVDADGAFGTGHVMGTDNANAVVIPANITCNVSLSSPDDQDGNPADNHVSLPNDGNAHNVTFSVSVTAGNASLVAVTLTSAELSALNCTLPAAFSLAANNTTNIVICTQGILCQQSGSINVHVQGNIDESGGVCARTSEPFLLNVISDCSGNIDCLSCPTCTISGPTAVCAGTKGSTFTVTPSAAGVAINWSITGNGTITSGTNGLSVTADAGAAGMFTLTAKVSVNGCTNTCNWPVTVNPNPTVNVNSPTICAGNNATISATVSVSTATPFSYVWTVPPTAVDPGNVSSFSASVTGTYSVVVTDANGCSGMGSGALNANPNPTCTVSGPNSVCVGTTNTYTSSATGATHSWTISGGGTITGATIGSSVQVVATDTNPYTVTDSITVMGCPGSCSQTVTVNPQGSIGDFIWQDLNGNGCQDPGEPGIAGVKVDLYSGACGGARTLIGSTTTDSTGHYLFSGLCPGDYQVSITTPTGYTATAPLQDCTPTPGQPADRNETNSKCNCEGASPCNICVTLTPTNPNNLNVDCGYVCNGQIGDFIWQDLNGNGCQDPGEPGIPGVKVDLYGGACNGTRTLIATTNTDSTGHYLFSGLCPGDYQVAITTPTGYTNTTPNVGCTNPNLPPSSNQLDSKCNCAGASPCFVCVTLTADSLVNLNVDCGYVCNGQIGDFIWADLNGNGCQDPGEPGIPGVEVDLYSGDCEGAPALIASTHTDSTGHYLFSGLCPGNYQVLITTPSGYTTTKPFQNCADNNLPPDQNQTDSKCGCVGVSPCKVCVTLTAANPVDLNIDCGYITTCPECVDTSLGLGAASASSVFQLGGGKVSIDYGGPQGVTGNVSIGPNGKLSMSGKTFISGSIYLASGATISKGNGNATGPVLMNQNLSAQIAAAYAAYNSYLALLPTQTYTGGNTITGVAGLNVVKVPGDLYANGKIITITGPAGATFIINVYGKLKLDGGGQIRVAGSVQPSDVIYNVIGTGADVGATGGGGGTGCCKAIYDGTILAPYRKIALSPGLVNGEIISGKDISIVSGSAVRCPVCIPTPSGGSRSLQVLKKLK